MDRQTIPLLEPGALFEGALFRDLLHNTDIKLEADMRFGAFRLVREIGRGGMGIVWLAERDDGEYQQRVAIKCIVDQRSERSAELFRHERQILAELRHPNIARILDGGRRDDGVLWFAMELIEGIAIDRHARETMLTLDQRLRLFARVLEAVGVAHARLVIHRDIKPDNVLVDSDGRPKLLDFGIAALSEDGTAARAWSPGWASPEQFDDGVVGTASDQFQLGLLLDALLSRDRCKRDAQKEPQQFDGARWISMPASRQRELGAVLARACADEVENRYGSVAELGRDIERLLEKRPLDAMRRRGIYPLACALRRRPMTFAISGLTLLLIAVLIGSFTWRLARERDTSRAEAARADAQAMLAKREAAKATAINRFLNEDLLSAADPFGRNIKDAPIGEVVERALPRVEARLGERPAIAGEVYLTLGQVLLNLGRTGPARDALDQANTALTTATGAESTEVVEARILRAEVEEMAGNYEEHARLLRALRVDLAALDARDARFINVDQRVAWADFLLGRYSEAESGYRDALERSQANPAVSELKRAMMHGARSLALARLNRAAEALDEARMGYDIRLRVLGPNDPGTLQSSLHVGNALVALERIDEAIPIYEHLHRSALDRFGPMHAETWIIAHELGAAWMRVAQPAKAVPYFEQAVAAKFNALGTMAASTVNSISWLGLAYLRTGQLENAEKTFLRVKPFHGETNTGRSAEISLRRNTGELRLAQGRDQDALTSCNAAALIARNLAETHPLRASTAACQGIALIQVGRVSAGRKLLEETLPALQAAGSKVYGWPSKVAEALGGPLPGH